MDLKQIEKLMSAMERMKIKRVVLKREEFEIEIEKECAEYQVSHMIPPPPVARPEVHAKAAPVESIGQKTAQDVSSDVYVTSPMVGTFYLAPSPDDPPFVKVGDQIEEGSLVCIIEAMKVMNEVKAEVSGTISEILIKNGDPVEFGTKLFKVT